MADLKRQISEAYGVLSADGVALRGLFIIDKDVSTRRRSAVCAFICAGRPCLHVCLAAPLAASPGRRCRAPPLRAQGVIQHSTINNLAFGRSVDETLRVLQALQYVQSHPDEVCPAGWQPGAKTMKPDPVGSKEFFAAI